MLIQVPLPPPATADYTIGLFVYCLARLESREAGLQAACRIPQERNRQTLAPLLSD
jgi:hypothetical protein